MDKRCETCRFWTGRENLAEGKDWGYCEVIAPGKGKSIADAGFMVLNDPEGEIVTKARFGCHAYEQMEEETA